MALSRDVLWTATDWRALRQYASPVFIRGNPFAITALLLLFSSLLQIVLDGISSKSAGFNMSAMGISFAMSAIATHYWRQVDNPLARAVPGLHTSEHRAALAFASILGFTIAFLLFHSGATTGGAAAYVGTALALGGFVPTQRSGTRAQTVLRGLLMLPVMLLSFIPNVQAWMLALPPWIGWPIAIGAMFGVSSSLSFDPARAIDNMDLSTVRDTSPRARAARVARGHSTGCLPAALSSNGIGAEIGGQVGRTLVFLAFSVPGTLIMAHGHGNTTHALKAAVNAQTPLAGALSILTAGDWLRQREDWPILFATGWHGTRAHFARVLTRAAARRILITSLTNAVLITGILLAIGSLSWRSAAIAACTIAGTLFGASWLPCAVVLMGRLGSRGMMFAGSTLGMILDSLAYNSAILGHHLNGFIGCGALFLVGLGLLLATPGRLARTDWPLETP